MATGTTERLYFSHDDEANALLARDPLALLVGFVLDQQVTVQKAFSSPLELARRLRGSLDAVEIAGMDTGELERVFAERPALHRFPGTMARRVQELCRAVVSEYDGDAARVWNEARDARDLEARLLALPGIGEMKAKTLVAVLAKRLGVRPRGWEDVAPSHPTLGVRPRGWEDVAPSHPTLGDVDSAEALAEYQAAKRAHKAALRARAAGEPGG